jgi:hypothetical protein
MGYSQLNGRIIGALDVLDALYFFLQSRQENSERLNRIREQFGSTPRHIRQNLLEELQGEVAWLRGESGALAPSSEYVKFFAEIRQKGDKGHVLIPKWEIDRRWFSKFGRVIPRWPYVKDHAMVLYDPKDSRVSNQLFELEGALFDDAKVLLEQARRFHRGIDDFRQRKREDQFLLHTYLHSTATVAFHFLEAYLNGLAFDCLLHHHDELSEDDHDALTEWDRKRAVRRFVSFEKKVFRYPMIVAKYLKAKMDLSGCRSAHFVANDAKELRDALTHPSPHLDRTDQTLRKISLIATVNLTFVEAVFDAARDYAVTVEKALFGKPEETAPWLFRQPVKIATEIPKLKPR